jgi:pyruvate formate lyase activating enzyme
MSDRYSRRQFIGKLGRCVVASASAGTCLFLATRASAGTLQKGLVGRRRSPYFTPLDERGVRCDLCPHECRIAEGARGQCGVRENTDGALWTRVYGNPCAVNIDPIEKKPFHHVLPGTRTLSIATAGCNLHCKFCQVWDVSQAGPEQTYNYELPPEEAVNKVELYNCQSIASSYVEPVVFIEYMLDIARRCRDQPILHVMHSAGFINRKPMEDVCRYLDAACIDLKGYSEDFYRQLVGGRLQPVLEALKTLRASDVHTEIVTLLIPGKNDDPRSVGAMSRWLVDELGPDVPLHFYRFYPRYKLKSIPPTPIPTLERARAAAMGEGLRYVYIANVPEHPGRHTYCPGCGKLVIRRTGFAVELADLVRGGCGDCGHAIPGVWQVRDVRPALPRG